MLQALDWLALPSGPVKPPAPDRHSTTSRGVVCMVWFHVSWTEARNASIWPGRQTHGGYLSPSARTSAPW